MKKFIVTIFFAIALISPVGLLAQEQNLLSGCYYGLNKDYGEFIYFYDNNFYYYVNLGEFKSYVQGLYKVHNSEIICSVKNKGFGQGWAENDISSIVISIQPDQSLKFLTKYGYDISEKKVFKYQKSLIKKVKINSLRLREYYNLQSKVKTILLKNESLILIMSVSEDVINSNKGNWVLVKTEDNEFGYCFDVYLE